MISAIEKMFSLKFSNLVRNERVSTAVDNHLIFIILAKYYNVSLDYLAGLTDTPRKLN